MRQTTLQNKQIRIPEIVRMIHENTHTVAFKKVKTDA
jgi:hypothetical protein